MLQGERLGTITCGTGTFYTYICSSSYDQVVILIQMLFVLVAGLLLQVTFSDYPLKRRLFCFINHKEVIRIDWITSSN